MFRFWRFISSSTMVVTFSVLGGVPAVALCYLIHQVQPGLLDPRHEFYMFEAVLISIWLAGLPYFVRRSRFYPLTDAERLELESSLIRHFTSKKNIPLIMREGLERSGGAQGHVHLRITKTRDILFKLLGNGTYCFIGSPKKLDRFWAVGRPEMVIEIQPRDVRGEIRRRAYDGAILLAEGYTGPAVVRSLR